MGKWGYNPTGTCNSSTLIQQIRAAEYQVFEVHTLDGTKARGTQDVEHVA